MNASVLCSGWWWPSPATENGDIEPAASDLRLTLDDDHTIDVTLASDDSKALASIPVEAVARLLAEAVGR